MKRIIALLLCLSLILCGCGANSSNIDISETTIPENIYEDDVASILFKRVPTPYILVREENGFYSLSVSVIKNGTEEDFGNYILAVKDAFEQTFSEDSRGYFSVDLLLDESASTFLDFRSSDYAEQPSTLTGTLFDHRSDELVLRRIESVESLYELFPHTKGFSPDMETHHTAEITEEPTSATSESLEDIVDETTHPLVETLSNQTSYVLNTNSRKFHYPGCSSAKKIKDSNRKDVTFTREELIEQGYDPCGRCHP